MINIANRTEYSFRFAYGHLNRVLDAQDKISGICDRHGTWGHVQFELACKKLDIKPIFGVELAYVPAPELKEKQGAQFVRFIAINNKGLRQIYGLVTNSTDENHFYYFPRIGPEDINKLDENVAVLMSSPMDLPEKASPYFDLNPDTGSNALSWARENALKFIASSDNYYPNADDKAAYEVCIGKNADDKQSPMHILNEWEWKNECVGTDEEKQAALFNTRELGERSNVKLQRAELVQPPHDSTLLEMCEEAAPHRGIDLSDPVYRERLDMELGLIAEKQYEDYFYLIADICKEAKKTMLVGPARGSSCGSLVCYLIEITEVDPIPYDLLFERFIDINRADLPDIDIDFPDIKRQEVFDYIRKTYGESNVAQLGTVSRFKAKSTISEVAKVLLIPQWEVQSLKDAIIERSGGDARAAFCIMDTFNELDFGKKILEKYPEIRIAEHIEQHARHSGKHAAGIVVTREPVNQFCSIDHHSGAAQVDKHDAEELNLLKIDVLGLRTLSVIEDCLDQIGWDKKKLLAHDLEDEKAFDILNSGKFAGIFQYEGLALQSLCKKMKAESFEDIVSITALARPGPLSSGMAHHWLQRRNGDEPVTYDHPALEPILKTSYGIVIYQENIMQIARDIGDMSWEDVSSLRKAMSKSLGKEFFDGFRKKFLEGAAKKGFDGELAEDFWERICTFGSWSFNRCLAGDTEILIARPNKYLPKRITIKELYERYFENADYYRNNHKPALTSLFGDGRCYPQKLVNIYKNGPKDCYEYTFSDGSKIKCTRDHKFMIKGEWADIGSAVIGDSFSIGKYEKKSFNNGRGKGHSKGKGYNNKQEGHEKGENNISWVNGKTKYFKEFKERKSGHNCEDCKLKNTRMEVHHNDFSEGDLRPKDMAWLCSSCHKERHYIKGRTKNWQKGYKVCKIELVDIKFHGMEETYDIEMPTHHNFLLGNGLITHNSHAVAYGMVSYWCLILKAYFPLEYAAACLRHNKSDDQCIKLLRELHHEGYGYVAFDKELSQETWSVQNGNLISGLIGVKGIGIKTAKDIMLRRSEDKALTKGQIKKMDGAVTPYDMIFEGRERWGHIMDNPSAHGIESNITDLKDIGVDDSGTFVVIAKIMDKNQRDHNELVKIKWRGGQRMEGQTLYLYMTVEDDTGVLVLDINKDKYLKIGAPIVEKGKIGDWYIFKGKTYKGLHKLYVDRWKKLSQ